MPFFKIETNQPVNPDGIQRILTRTSEFTSETLNKPEQSVMVLLVPEKRMMFSGNNDPVAFVQLKRIGLPIESCTDLTSRICQFLAGELGFRPTGYMSSLRILSETCLDGMVKHFDPKRTTSVLNGSKPYFLVRLGCVLVILIKYTSKKAISSYKAKFLP